MNLAAKILLALGFILSIATNFFLLLIITALLALYTYIGSIFLRVVGWLVSSQISRFNILTGLTVLIFGGVVLAGGLGELTSLILAWSVYTVVEAITYFRLRSYSKFYLPAMISLLSVAIALYLVWMQGAPQYNDYDEALPTFMVIFVINILSALFALVGTILARKPLEIEQT